MKLMLVRHGETIENVQKRIQGQTSGHLSEHGKEQVRAVARALSNENIACIYSSDLARCVLTAEAIHEYHKQAPLILTPRLREFATGKLQGLPVGLLRWAAPLGNIIPFRPPGIESNHDVQTRLITIVNEAFSKYPHDSIIFVSHSGPIEVLSALIEERSPNPFEKKHQVANASVHRFDVNAPLTQ